MEEAVLVGIDKDLDIGLESDGKKGCLKCRSMDNYRGWVHRVYVAGSVG